MFYCQTLIQKILCSNIFVFTCGCVVPLRHSVCMDPEIFSGGGGPGIFEFAKGGGFFLLSFYCVNFRYLNLNFKPIDLRMQAAVKVKWKQIELEKNIWNDNDNWVSVFPVTACSTSCPDGYYMTHQCSTHHDLVCRGIFLHHRNSNYICGKHQDQIYKQPIIYYMAQWHHVVF